MRGVVTQVIYNRGFGFIRGDDGLSRFFHASFVIPEVAFDTLALGDVVDFDPDVDGPDGKLRAKKVQRRK
jgi:cold shock CspA family protein